jgi:hypothetical protein
MRGPTTRIQHALVHSRGSTGFALYASHNPARHVLLCSLYRESAQNAEYLRVELHGDRFWHHVQRFLTSQPLWRRPETRP